MESFQNPHQEPLIGEDLLPRQSAKQEGDEERGDQENQRQCLQKRIFPQLHPDHIGDGIAQEQGKNGGQCRVDKGARNMGEVGGDHFRIVLPPKGGLKLTEKPAGDRRLETGDHQGKQWRHKEQDEIQNPR